METVTFGHFSDVSWMGVPFVMSLTTMRAKESNMAAVFVGLHSEEVGHAYGPARNSVSR